MSVDSSLLSDGTQLLTCCVSPDRLLNVLEQNLHTNDIFEYIYIYIYISYIYEYFI